MATDRRQRYLIPVNARLHQLKPPSTAPVIAKFLCSTFGRLASLYYTFAKTKNS